MIDQILTRKNMLRAMHQVQRNHGSAGIDHMPVTSLSELMSIDRDDLITQVRPGKSLHQAVQKGFGYINDGYQHIVDIDLQSFFDEVDHCYLLQLLHRKLKCPATMRLIRKWLRAPIWIDGTLVKRRKGVPQGSPQNR